MHHRSGWARAAPSAGVHLLVLLTLGPLACGVDRAPRIAAADGRYGGTLVIAGATDLDHANPLVTADAWTQEVNRFLLFMPLIRYGPALELEPYLARSWTFHGDTAVTFHLRDDVLWHDGRKTTAADVRFTYERAMDARTTYPNAAELREWTSVELIDSFTVRVGFRPHAEPLAAAAVLPIAPAHRLADIAPGELKLASFNRAPIGNGPFRFVSRRAGQHWVFEANRTFPLDLGGRPRVDRLVWRVVPDRTARVAELLSGGAHVLIDAPADGFTELDRHADLRGLARPSFRYAFIGWNGKRVPFGDARVRRALTMAIDRETLLHVVRAGFGEIATGPVHPDHWAHDPSLDPVPFDTERARELLAAAGLADRDGDGRIEAPHGEPMRFDLKLPARSEVSRRAAEVVHAQLASIGVEVRIRPTEWSTLVGDVSSPERNFDAVLMGLTSDFRIDDLHNYFHSANLDGPFQLASYQNPDADRLIDRVASAANREDALPVWHELQHILREDQPWSFLYYFPDLILARNSVHGMEMDLRGTLATAPVWWIH